MYKDGRIVIGKSGEEEIWIRPSMANRHGMIAGATGTGKTITLKVMAESFSDAGVPVFLADVKGDLAGMCNPGSMNESLQKRIDALGISDFDFRKYPTVFWDVYQEKGIALRTTISEMGPLLLARILGLNDTQTDILTVIFKIADDENLLLIDTKDLKSMISYVGDKAKEYSLTYGNIAKQSLSAIVRAIVALEAEGGDLFFGEPALDIHDWLATDENGKGKIHVLDCQKLILNPTMYATFLLWMMAELFETLPEAGDLEKPRMVFFFDEAHMLFDHASKELLDKVEQVVKLIRSKGVGIYFITQTPKDIPDGVLSQLGNKVQHALHAYTPADQKYLKAAADAFRTNPAFDTKETLEVLGVGEALVSVMAEDGAPTVVERVAILPPQSQMGAIDDGTRQAQINNNLLASKYANMVDRDSAFEFFQRMGIEEGEAKAAAEKEAADAKAKEKQQKTVKREAKKVASSAAGTIGRTVGNTVGSAVGGKFGRTLGGNIGASLGRGILNTLFKS
ncbi:MAG: DUF853 family protein [Lachnospiraceae bacterium]|nr:DUF853 family protein [Lachnospiraceae bacterium]